MYICIMYICIYVYMYICTYVYVYVYICFYVHVNCIFKNGQASGVPSLPPSQRYSIKLRRLYRSEAAMGRHVEQQVEPTGNRPTMDSVFCFRRWKTDLTCLRTICLYEATKLKFAFQEFLAASSLQSLFKCKKALTLQVPFNLLLLLSPPSKPFAGAPSS